MVSHFQDDLPMFSSAAAQDRLESNRFQVSTFHIGFVDSDESDRPFQFHDPDYPIWLNQPVDENMKSLKLCCDYYVEACLEGSETAERVDPASVGFDVLPILRYGFTSNAVPQPRCMGKTLLEEVTNEFNADTQTGTLSVKISKECLSSGGFEHTVRLRLLLVGQPLVNTTFSAVVSSVALMPLTPSSSTSSSSSSSSASASTLVIDFVDSPRFAIMTKNIPEPVNLVSNLRKWWVKIHSADKETLSECERQMKTKSGKKNKVQPPAAPAVEDESDDQAFAMSLPDGSHLMTWSGLCRLATGFEVALGLAPDAASRLQQTCVGVIDTTAQSEARAVSTDSGHRSSRSTSQVKASSDDSNTRVSKRKKLTTPPPSAAAVPLSSSSSSSTSKSSQKRKTPTPPPRQTSTVPVPTQSSQPSSAPLVFDRLAQAVVPQYNPAVLQAMQQSTFTGTHQVSQLPVALQSAQGTTNASAGSTSLYSATASGPFLKTLPQLASSILLQDPEIDNMQPPASAPAVSLTSPIDRFLASPSSSLDGASTSSTASNAWLSASSSSSSSAPAVSSFTLFGLSPALSPSLNLSASSSGGLTSLWGTSRYNSFSTGLKSQSSFEFSSSALFGTPVDPSSSFQKRS